jgi:hypothetical protein
VGDRRRPKLGFPRNPETQLTLEDNSRERTKEERRRKKNTKGKFPMKIFYFL